MRHALALIATLVMTMPAAAEKISLGEISRYLNSFKTASGEFTQINADGTISTGQIYIKRPGRVRFEFNPPARTLVVADGDTVGVIEGRGNTQPEAYPLHRTPLKIILARNVDFSRARMVTGHSSDGQSTIVRAQDPDNPEYGNIELVFTGTPTELRQWVINDGSGNKTTVVLGELNKGVQLANEQFVIPGKGNSVSDR
ncbi:MAG: outer membrane lipoprotein carrier protein LolA [Pseudomonadota bacterium]